MLAIEFIGQIEFGLQQKSFYIKCFNIHHLLSLSMKFYYPLRAGHSSATKSGGNKTLHKPKPGAGNRTWGICLWLSTKCQQCPGRGGEGGALGVSPSLPLSQSFLPTLLQWESKALQGSSKQLLHINLI